MRQVCHTKRLVLSTRQVAAIFLCFFGVRNAVGLDWLIVGISLAQGNALRPSHLPRKEQILSKTIPSIAEVVTPTYQYTLSIYLERLNIDPNFTQ